MSEFSFTWQAVDRIRISGRDSSRFLQGMVTNDVQILPEGGGCYAFHLDSTGHVLADLTILNCGTALELAVEPGFGESLATSLEQYRIMERCRIDYLGKGRTMTLWGIGVQQWANTQDGRVGFGANEGDHVVVSDVPEDNHLVRMPLQLGVCYRWWLPPEAHDRARDLILALGATERSSSDWEALRVRAGIPVFGIDFDSRTLAPETAQEGRAIHYRKGCYIGQEIVARIDARGRVRRTLCRLTLSEPLPSGTELNFEGEKAGRITSSARDSDSGLVYGIGYVRQEFQALGAVFTSEGRPVAELTPSSLDGGPR